jgi:Domain of unknown function (DUF5642)
MPLVACVRWVCAALLTAVTAGVGLPGCGSDGQPRPAGSPASAPTSAASPAGPPAGYDISRIAQLANEFPPGYSVSPVGPITLSQEQADSFVGMVKKLGSTFEPRQCAEVLKHPTALAGSTIQGFQASGPQQIMVAAAQTAQPVPSVVPPAECDHVTFNDPGKVQGTVDRLPPPAIDGATVVVVKVHVEATDSGISKTLDQYQYQATLNDRTGVDVSGESDTHLLESLLGKAVMAVRGR